MIMPQTFREVRHTTVRESNPDVVQEKEVTTSATDTREAGSLAARVISLISGIILALLGMRFILSLLGANRGNTFADFIYTASHPFVAPFFGLFNYQQQFGSSHFEFETLIAMAFWAFIAWVAIQLFTLGNRAGDNR